METNSGQRHEMASGADFLAQQRPFSLDDPTTWRFRPQILVHDVGTTEDRSTAVLGGIGGYAPDPKIGVAHMEELPRGLRGTPRANALAEVDIRFDRNSIIIADLSNDQSYAEQLSQTFGARVIGVSIGPSGDGMTFQRIPVPHGAMLKYALGRTWLFDRLRSMLENGWAEAGARRPSGQAGVRAADGSGGGRRPTPAPGFMPASEVEARRSGDQPGVARVGSAAPACEGMDADGAAQDCRETGRRLGSRRGHGHDIGGFAGD